MPFDIPTDWIHALLGGMVVGLASIFLLVTNGRIFGVSGILGGVLIPRKDDIQWRLSVVIGLVAGGFVLKFVYPQAFDQGPVRSVALTALAGLLVGIGTRMGSGCTSGHGICGISRLSIRSLAATVTFLVTGVLTATFLGWLGVSP